MLWEIKVWGRHSSSHQGLWILAKKKKSVRLVWLMTNPKSK